MTFTDEQIKIQNDLNSGVKSLVEEYKELAPEIQKQLELDGTKADLYMELKTSIKDNIKSKII